MGNGRPANRSRDLPNDTRIYRQSDVYVRNNNYVKIEKMSFNYVKIVKMSYVMFSSLSVVLVTKEHEK